jgi:very-short-patch-repair endonuclease
MYPPKATIARAKKLRRALTLPEVILWLAIRRQKLGARFRRQHPVGPYVLDFYCEAARLAVEVDGVSHEHPNRIQHDARRTAWLNLRGITVYRLAARDVLGNLEGVLVSLRTRVCRPHPSAGGTESVLPHRGWRKDRMRSDDGTA